MHGATVAISSIVFFLVFFGGLGLGGGGVRDKPQDQERNALLLHYLTRRISEVERETERKQKAEGGSQSDMTLVGVERKLKR